MLRRHLLNGKMCMVKSFKRRVLFLATSPVNRSSVRTFSVHDIDFQFEFAYMKILPRQFHVHLAFSPPVNKEKGTALSKLVVDLRVNFFSAGQLYLALPRTRRSSDVY